MSEIKMNTNQNNVQNTNQINQLLYNKYIDYVFLLKSRNYEVKYYNYNEINDFNNKFIFIYIYDIYGNKVEQKITTEWDIVFQNNDLLFDALIDYPNNQCGFCILNVNNANNHHTLLCPYNQCKNEWCKEYGHTYFNCPKYQCECHWSVEYDNDCIHTMDDDNE
jgi:hypothetical protein